MLTSSRADGRIEGEIMARVTKVGHQDAPAWEVAQKRLLELQDERTLSFSVADDTFLIVLRITALGYLVSGCGEGDRDYYTLIERTLGDDPVTAFDGGNTNEYPRYTFVSEPLLLKAVKTYFHTGQRDRECEWVPEEDAVYG
jgi:Immunity protein Imm1